MLDTRVCTRKYWILPFEQHKLTSNVGLPTVIDQPMRSLIQNELVSYLDVYESKVDLQEKESLAPCKY